MLIRVLRRCGTYDYVKPALLNRLLEEEQLASFHRQGGEAILGAAPVRRKPAPAYSGAERRAQP